MDHHPNSNSHPEEKADEIMKNKFTEEDGNDNQRQVRRQKWQQKEQCHVAAAAVNSTTHINSLKGGSMSVVVNSSSDGIVETTKVNTPPKPSDRWNKDENKMSVVSTSSSNNNNDDSDRDEGVAGDDLFPRLEEDTNDTSTATKDEPMQAVVPFEETRSKIGDLFANRKSPSSSATASGSAINSDPILLPSSEISASATKIKRKRIMATGLGNLGNTCFMNSTLQCLAHTLPLREYFLSGKFNGDLNTDNPLGTGGELAKEFASLLEQMWQVQKKEGGSDNPAASTSNGSNGSNGIYSSSRIYSPGNYDSGLSSVTYPRSFKHTLGKHAEQFVGYDQHDSQELAIYLLDALHEDTNRVRKKPYVEKPEQAEDESDHVASEKAWNAHLQREDSRILESFMGQIKSRLRCPTEGCGRVSTTFDPSMYLSVPIPGSTDRVVKVTFVPLLPMPGGGQQQKQDGCCPAAAEMSIKLCKNSTIKTLRARVAEMARECYGFSATELFDEDIQFADIFQQNVYSYYRDDYAIDGIKDNDVTYAYQLYPLTRVKEECKIYQEEQQQEINKSINSGSDSSSATAASSSLSSLLDPAVKEELDSDPKKWEQKLSGTFLSQPSSIYRITNERRSSHADRLAFYGKLLKFIQKCKLCSDAVVDDCGGNDANEDGDVVMNTSTNCDQDHGDTDVQKKEKKKSNREDSSNSSAQTLEEVSHISHQFKGVRTPRDLALLEYCASKLLNAIRELKNPSSLNSKNMKDMNEKSTVVQIKIKKIDPAHIGTSSYSTGVAYHNRNNTYGKPSSSTSWKVIGEPVLVRISPTLTVDGLRNMLGQRISGALKLKNDPHHNQQDATMTGAAAPLMSSEMVMKQVALSYTNGRGANNRYGGNGADTLGTVEEDQLANNHGGAARATNQTHTESIAKSSDKEEKELVSSMVENEGTIFVSWPPQFNDIFEEDMLFATDEFLTEQQKKEKELTPSGETKGVSVMDCIAKYCETEQLDESDMWYCNRCKGHVRAWKQFHLYRTPPILVIHLKRFHFSSTTHRRDKIDTLIDFPLEDLDLRDVVKHWDKGGGGEEEQAPIYDCYAVSNHFGGLGGGHYTAFAKGDDGSWCNFDDSRVTTGVDESEVVSTAAYCLYYKRKDVVFDTFVSKQDADALMTKEDESSIGPSLRFDQGAMPVSPSPCIEDGRGVAKSSYNHQPDNDNYDTSMEVDNQDDGSAASYATPTDGMDGDTTSTSSVLHQPVTDKDDVFFDLQ